MTANRVTRGALAFATAVGAAAAVACGSGSSGGSSGTPSNLVTLPSGGFPIVLQIVGTPSFTATFQGQTQTITAAGTYTFNGVQIGTYAVSGQLTPSVQQAALTFNFGTPDPSSQSAYGGQVQHNATNIVGPGTNQGGCGILYQVPSTQTAGTSPIAFSFTLTIASASSFTTSNTPCKAPS